MKKARSFVVVLFAVFIVSTLSAHAALELRGTDSIGNRLIYDSDLNITWYDYTMSAAIWKFQANWASGLTVDFGGTIYDDWRLPSTTQPDPNCGYQYNPGGGFPLKGYGYNCTGSEMGHLYYTELGNLAGGGLTKTGDFQHLKSSLYWSGTESTVIADYAWVFYTYNGYQIDSNKNWLYYGIAVRAGDVAPTVVPEPISSILFVAGGALLAGRRLLKRGRS